VNILSIKWRLDSTLLWVVVEKRVNKVGYLREVVAERIGRLRPIEESGNGASETRWEE